MLCSAFGALGSENDTAGFELPIRRAHFKTTDCYSVEQHSIKIEMAAFRQPVLYLSAKMLREAKSSSKAALVKRSSRQVPICKELLGTGYRRKMLAGLGSKRGLSLELSH
jgi:hypothetical protein